MSAIVIFLVLLPSRNVLKGERYTSVDISPEEVPYPLNFKIKYNVSVSFLFFCLIFLCHHHFTHSTTKACSCAYTRTHTCSHSFPNIHKQCSVSFAYSFLINHAHFALTRMPEVSCATAVFLCSILYCHHDET